jgi:hypothetical protein
MTKPTDDKAPATYAEMVSELLAAEDSKRESLEARAKSVVSVSGALVSILLGIAALITADKAFTLANSARHVLSSVLGFVLSALLASLTFLPQAIRITDPVELARLLPGMWESTGPDAALKRVTATRLEASARRWFRG